MLYALSDVEKKLSQKMDSGQIKCLAFRYFNERKVLNGCDERNSMTPVP